MKKNNSYSLVKKFNISTTKTSVEYAHQAHAHTGFFLVSDWLVLGKSLRLDTKKQLTPSFVSLCL